MNQNSKKTNFLEAVGASIDKHLNYYGFGLALFIFITLLVVSCQKQASKAKEVAEVMPQDLYLDVHDLEPGKVTFEAVAQAHQKDLATQDHYHVKFKKYWVDEAGGKVYCLAQAPDSASLYLTHRDAHGLVPDRVMKVKSGDEAQQIGNRYMFIDIHELGPGNVTKEAAEEAHQKDLATQGKYGVNFINYWVDEKLGILTCLSEAADSMNVLQTHKEAHGLMPTQVRRVKQGE